MVTTVAAILEASTTQGRVEAAERWRSTFNTASLPRAGMEQGARAPLAEALHPQACGVHIGRLEHVAAEPNKIRPRHFTPEVLVGR